MHVEVLKARLESLKDFAKHYLMIVLSILTALGLEAWIEHAHHEHAAQAATAQIEAEIRTNLAEVRGSLAKDGHQAEVLASIRNALLDDFKAHATDRAITSHIQALVAIDSFNLNLSWPTLRQEAWDVAVANQSASWIDEARMRRYSAAYASQRDMATTLGANLALVMNGPRMMDAMTDLRTSDIQPREFLHVISQMAAMLQQAQNNLRVLEKHLQEGVDASPAH
jgi:hypothetical protein